MIIRPFTQQDYPAIAEIANAVYPDYPTTSEELRHRDQSREPKIKWGRYLALVDQVPVGFGIYGQDMAMYHPHKFWLEIQVLPGWQGKGVGRALNAVLEEALKEHRAAAVRTGVREDFARSLRFVQDRGYREEQRAWESRLDLASFDPAPYAGLEARLLQQGIEIRSMRELEQGPQRDRRLYQLELAVDRDMPQPEAFTEYSFETFQKNVLQHPRLIPEAYLVALKGDEYIGVSTLWGSREKNNLTNGATGTLRAWRRKGIALAMKVKNILWAKAAGFPEIKTWNNSINRPMLAINERLGFVKQPAWIGFIKELGEP